MIELFQWALNPFGLVLNMVGVTLAFFYGYPQPALDDTVRLSLGEFPRDHVMPTGETRGEQKDRIARQKKTHYFRSRLGLVLMFAGFLAQLISVIIAS